MVVVLQMHLFKFSECIIFVYTEASETTLCAVDESKWYTQNYSQGESKIFCGKYVDTVDCDVAPMSACHLLLGRPWQYDLDATHGGHSNSYSFVHKGVHHVLKPMHESTIKSEVFASIRKNKMLLLLSKSRGRFCFKRERMM